MNDALFLFELFRAGLFYSIRGVLAMIFSPIRSISFCAKTNGASRRAERHRFMTQIEQELLETLLELERSAARMPAANPKPDLRPLFARVEALTGRLPRGTDPDLLHYLHRKSYQKARAFLQQR
jgi:hypothetical protein